MTTQTKALKLADELMQPPCKLSAFNAALELRRLYAELERCKQVCDATAESWRADAEEWKAQRDALLEALRELLADAEFLGWDTAKARAAIKVVEDT